MTADTNNTTRTTAEAEFWDKDVKTKGGFRDHLYAGPVTSYFHDEIARGLGDLKGCRVLYVGCGKSAGSAKSMVKKGAEVWCVDISPESIKALMAGVDDAKDRIHGVVGDAENLPFDDESFDVVVGKAIVHHLDVAKFMAEVARVSAPGGRFVFSEPLGTNPLIRLFRRLTPKSRVPTEHPLMPRDFRTIRKYCSSLSKRPSALISLTAVPWFFLGLPSIGAVAFKIGCALDRFLFTVCPPTGWLAWNVLLTGQVSERAPDLPAERSEV